MSERRSNVFNSRIPLRTCCQLVDVCSRPISGDGRISPSTVPDKGREYLGILVLERQRYPPASVPGFFVPAFDASIALPWNPIPSGFSGKCQGKVQPAGFLCDCTICVAVNVRCHLDELNALFGEPITGRLLNAPGRCLRCLCDECAALGSVAQPDHLRVQFAGLRRSSPE
jgi:hypothetical protein